MACLCLTFLEDLSRSDVLATGSPHNKNNSEEALARRVPETPLLAARNPRMRLC
jgi:hypothetical protein